MCKRYFKNIYNHISQGICHHDLVCNDVVVLNGEDGVNENSSPEHCSAQLHEVGQNHVNEICNHVSKRLKSTTTTMVSTRKSTEKTDELVNREFDHCDDFDDNVSIQMSNTDINNQVASWQQRNDKTEALFESESDNETKDGIESSACHVTFANNQGVDDNDLYQVCGSVHQVNENICDNIS